MFLLVMMLAYTIQHNQLAMFIVKKSAENALRGTGQKIENTQKEKLMAKHPELSPEGGLSNSGQRGHGLSLLLIDRISAESYVKELLSLYRDSEQGKVTNNENNFPALGLLGIHYNETGVYSGTIIPRSYLPFENGKIIWNQPYKGLPAEAMTLKKFNNVAASLAGVNVQSNGMSSTGKYVNAFQINRDYFSWIPPAKLTGYNSSPGRNADVFFLPDSLSYINGQFSQMLNLLGAEGKDPMVQTAMYSIWHNAGSGYLQTVSSFGVSPTGGWVKSVGSNKEDYGKNASIISEDLVKASKKYGNKLTTITKDEAPGAGLILLLDSGYFLSERAYLAYTTGLPRSDGTYNRSSALLSSWKKLKGETLTQQQMASKLRSYVKTIPQAYPGYATNSEVGQVYGTRYIDDNKGPIFKLSEHTSNVYRNKINGKDPRVLHVTNAETVGHMFSAVTGEQVYANLLKLSGVNVDETDPSDYLEDVENEFIPGAGTFDMILKKVGVTSIDPKAKDMLEEGFRVSGFYYNYGGKGDEVTQDNYEKMDNAYFLSAQYTSRDRDIYRTKDGTDPGASKHNRRNSNLVHYGKRVFDCSGLVGWAYNKTIGKTTGINLMIGSSQMYSSSAFKTISKSELKPGDILVKKGHVYFFLGHGNSVSLSQTDSKTEKTHIARSGYIWSLEAAETGTKVGVRATKIKPAFIARRIKGIND